MKRHNTIYNSPISLAIYRVITIICTLILFVNISCKKLVEIPQPISSITTSVVFSTDAEATAAMSGVYYNMVNNYSPVMFTGGITIFAGMSADELLLFNQPFSALYQFNTNSLTANNSGVSFNLWTAGFSTAYATNAVLEGVAQSTGITDSVKTELTAEAKFVRAFSNFYLINLFGDIPLVTTTNWRKTNLLGRTPVQQVYEYIVSDLKDAQAALPDDYRVGKGQRIIPNKWSATALLARVYLYLGDWVNAEAQASLVIGSDLFSLPTDLNTVFKTTSPEAIWQLQPDNTNFSYNGTREGNYIIPFNHTLQPNVYLTNSLLADFEAGDDRKVKWIDSTIYSGTTYYYPFKYKVGPAQAVSNGAFSEYYTPLRLSEQYLIRAEARTRLGTNLTGAAADINTVRIRAGLSPTGATIQSDLLQAVLHERQIELFAEWGHRWLDLKRWGQAASILTTRKGFTVSNNQLLYPIPQGEITVDPNFTQNPGY